MQHTKPWADILFYSTYFSLEGHIASVDVVVVAQSQSHVQLLVTP